MPRKPDVPCSLCGQLMWRGTGSAAHPICRPCRSSTQPRTHGASGYSKGCRCDICRAGVRDRMREYSARRRESGAPLHKQRRTVPATCAGCGVLFEARADSVAAGWGKFCTARCRNLSNIGRDPFSPVMPKRRTVSKVRRHAEARAAKALRGSAGGYLWVQGPCIVCAAPFMSRGKGARYCSPSCSRFAKTRKNWISFAGRIAIYRRDNFTCQICTEPVDWHSDPVSDWYPSLDHIIPRSHGGSDDPENLRLAHRWCNSVRGDLSYYTDLDLVA